MNLKMKNYEVETLRMRSIRETLEGDRTFQYWNKSIGLTFNDFSVYSLIGNNNAKVLKEGKKDIGDYCIYMVGNMVDSISFDMDNESVRQHHLKMIGKAV